MGVFVGLVVVCRGRFLEGLGIEIRVFFIEVGRLSYVVGILFCEVGTFVAYVLGGIGKVVFFSDGNVVNSYNNSGSCLLRVYSGLGVVSSI